MNNIHEDEVDTFLYDEGDNTGYWNYYESVTTTRSEKNILQLNNPISKVD